VSETSELDQTRRYLMPVGRLQLPDEADVIHLSLFEWMPRAGAWGNGLSLCGASNEGPPLPEGTEVTCPGCQHYQPTYQAVLNPQAAAAAGQEEQRRLRDAAGDTTENGAWFTVWLEGNWSWVTKKMTTPQREYAADCVAAYHRYLATEDGELERGEPEGLRWWREAGR
jgi:hypothetical protein